MFKIVGQHVPPPTGVPSPLKWGTEPRLEDLLGGECDLVVTRRNHTFRFRSAVDYFETFKAFYGPLVNAFAALDEPGRRSLSDQLVGLANGYNRKDDTALRVDAEYAFGWVLAVE